MSPKYVITPAAVEFCQPVDAPTCLLASTEVTELVSGVNPVPFDVPQGP